MPDPSLPPPVESPPTEPAPPLQTIALGDLLAPTWPEPPQGTPRAASQVTMEGEVQEAAIALPPRPAPVRATVPPSPQPTPAPSLPPPAEPVLPPAPDTTHQVQAFLDQLASTTGLSAQVPAPELFPEASLYFQATDPALTFQADILNAAWLEGPTPEQVYLSILSSQLQSANFQTTQKADFGGGIVYEIVQGSMVWYLNLVPTANGQGTIIVVWKREPGEPPAG